MDFEEKLERSRQAVMRLRELLDLMHEEIEWGEAAYEQLFAHLTEEQRQTLKQKDAQGWAAIPLVDDPTPLQDAALHLRFACRNLERDFEQLHDNLSDS